MIVINPSVRAAAALSRVSFHGSGETAEIVTKGQHDPDFGIRVVPVGEATAVRVILDRPLVDRARIDRRRKRTG